MNRLSLASIKATHNSIDLTSREVKKLSVARKIKHHQKRSSKDLKMISVGILREALAMRREVGKAATYNLIKSILPISL